MSSHRRPPESSAEEREGVIEARMSSDFGRMPPLKDLRTDGIGHKQHVRWSGTWVWMSKFLTIASISHKAVATTQVGDSMVFGSVPAPLVPTDEREHQVFLELGLYVMVKWNLPKNKAHRAWREFNRLAERR